MIRTSSSSRSPVAGHGLAGAVAVAVVGCVLDLVGFSRVLAGEPSSGWVIGYAALGYVALVARHRAPVTVFGVLWLHSTVAVVLVPSYGPVVGMMIALYTVSALAPRRAGWWALAATFVPTGVRVATEVGGAPPGQVVAVLVGSAVLLSLISGGAWSLGRWERAQQERLELLARQREQAARDAVHQERNRIARDLHDVIAHSVSVMTLQAAGARRVLAGNPERADRALADIQGAGTQAMTELRRLLTVLRSDDPTTPDGPEQHLSHGLADLDGLLDRVRTAGVPARCTVEGTPRALDPGVDLSAYRVVQESLTNVAKHVGAGVPTLVALTWGDRNLGLSITNTAPAPDGDRERGGRSRPVAAPAGGHGLIGLRERVAAVGGTLESGCRPEGGFHVSVTLPAPPAPDRRGDGS